ncbi:MAG TPA: sulfotransferase, partial [Tepidisphaeraceae bacterium]|nr:sulfotransferase [Tepidisphaeraceae bacterium]
ENKALLLAASLRRNLKCDFELVAAIPTPAELFATPSQTTLSLLGQMSVRIVKIKNEIHPDYPIGNKVSCLKIETDHDRLVFLDTDMLLLRPFCGIPSRDIPFAAKPADLPNIICPRQWRRAYSAAGIRVPEARVATTLFGTTVLPYFNAGFIAVDPLAGLGDAWVECCRRIDARWGIRLKRPHLDQIALPVAVAKLQLPYLSLDERYNFPAHLKPIDGDNLPFFAHYHCPSVIRREPALADLVRSLCAEYPDLAEPLEIDEDYAPLFKPPPSPSAVSSGRSPRAISTSHRKSGPMPEIIITGIPRSGTSYLCNLLNRFDNAVVLNEPDGIARSLRKEPIPYGVATFYRDIRRDVLEGRPIQNKLRDGKVTDETVGANEQSAYVPTVVNDDFVLGVKNPLGFLSRLRGLRRAMPHARVAVCVRNPFDTIASWKTTFEHLKTAQVADLWNGGLQDPTLSARARKTLEDIAQLKRPAWRRAAWWRYLADLVLEAAPDVIIVPYRQAVLAPMPIVDRILCGHDRGVLREPIEPSTLRTARRSALDAEDHQAIRALCGEPASALGILEEGQDVLIDRQAAAPDPLPAAPVTREPSRVFTGV